MSTLREAAQDALTAYETFRDVDDIDGLDDVINALRAALAQPESEAHPPRDEWRPASVDCRTCRHLAKLDCMSTAMCIDGSQYKPTNPVQMWEKTP